MNVFEAVKGKVTARQAAEMYGVRVNRHGMAVCPFHNDKKAQCPAGAGNGVRYE